MVAVLVGLLLFVAFPSLFVRPINFFCDFLEKGNFGSSRDPEAAARMEARNEKARRDAEEARVAAAVTARLPSATVRIQRVKDDVEIFLSRQALETVAFPDREELFTQIGRE